MPWTQFKSSKADSVKVKKLEGDDLKGGSKKFSRLQPAWNGLGPLQVLGMLIEGHAILLKARDDGMGENEFNVKNLTSLIDGLRTANKNEINKIDDLISILDVYIDKYIDILKVVYYPNILTMKSSVKAVGSRIKSNKDGFVAEFRNARYKTQLVQSHLLLALYYFSILYHPDTYNNQWEIEYTTNPI